MDEALKQNEAGRAAEREWNYHPDFPIDNNPLFSWPPRISDTLTYYRDSWLTLSEGTIFTALAILVLYFAHPSLTTTATLDWTWIAAVYARNFITLLVVAGGLHVYFYTLRSQETELKYVKPFLSRGGSRFNFQNQLHDNAFWSLGSGVLIWTGFEVLCLWAMGNGHIRAISFAEMPVWSVLALPAIFMWVSFHFYCVHRLLHTKLLYDWVHVLHHRNINVGPWSGLSMHPVEHLFYFSSLLIHFVVPTHPMHILFHFYTLSLSAVFGHTGFDALLVKNRRRLAIGHFHHQLHHRYFECNYGSVDMPWDVFFGTFHDGTQEARKRMMKRIRKGQR
jgi:lathosterol oxidase